MKTNTLLPTTHRRRFKKSPPRFRRCFFEILEQKNLLAAQVVTDKLDYGLGETAQIYASGFQVGESVQFQVLHTDGTPNTGNGHDPWVVADGGPGDLDGVADGNIHTTWYVDPDDSRNAAFLLTADGLTSGLSAFTTFTDAGSSSSQYANLTPQYQSGNLNSTNSAYTEGESIPFRYLVSDAQEGARIVIDFVYQFQQSDTGARTYDFLTSDDFSEPLTDAIRFGPANANKPTGFDLTTCTNPLLVPIPDDPTITTDFGGNFLVCGNVPISAFSVSFVGVSSNDKTVRLVLDLGDNGMGAANEDIVDFAVFWGGHLARDSDYPGANNGAADAPGSSFHMEVEAFWDKNLDGIRNDGGGTNFNGGTSHSIQGAVVRNTSLEWEKRSAVDPFPLLGGATFTVSPDPFTGSLTPLVIVDNGVFDANPADGQFLLNDVLFATYTITETIPPPGYLLDVDVTREETVDTNNVNAVVGVMGQDDPGTTDESDFHNTPANAEIDVEKYVSIDGGVTWFDADTPTGPILNSGTNPQFRFVVTNTGNVDLSNVTLTDSDFNIDTVNNDMTVDIGTLAVGAMYELIFTNAVWMAGQHSNTATALGDAPGQMVSDTDLAHYFGAVAEIDVEKYVSIDGGVTWFDADTPTGPFLNSGTDPQFRFVVTNTGNVDLSNVTLTDSDFNIDTVNNDMTIDIGTLAVGAMYELIFTGAVWMAGQHSNTATASGSFTDDNNDTDTATDTDLAHYFGAAPAIDVEKYVSIDGGVTWFDADTPTGPFLNSGTDPQFRFVVTNTGNVDLSNVTLTDSDFNIDTVNNDMTVDIGTLAVGAMYELIFTNAVWMAGQHSNTATAVGDAPGQMVSDTDLAHYFGAVAEIDVEKYVSIDGGVTWFDADTPTGPFLNSGTNPQFRFVVTNTGNVDLSNVTLTDSDFNIDTVNNDMTVDIGTLAVGAMYELIFTNAVWMAGQHSNTATASGSFTDDNNDTDTATDTDLAHYFGAAPAIDVEKYVSIDGGVNWIDADTPTGPFLNSGTNPQFRFVVTNIGNVDLSNVTLTDSDFNIDTVNNDMTVDIGTLAVGAMYELIFTGAVWMAGQHSNTATASGSFTDDNNDTDTATDTDLAHYFGADAAIAIDKVTVDGPIAGDNFRILVGEPIVWRYTVTNVGNVPLSMVTVTDNQPGVTPAFQGGDTNGNSILDLGEVWVYTAPGVAQPDWYVNIGTARGRFTDSTGQTRVASAADRSAYFGADPKIAIDKVTVDGPIAGDNFRILVGEPIVWRYTVTNVGNVPLSVVTVTDNQPGVTPVYQSGDTNGNNRLDLGEIWVYTAPGVAQPDWYVNIGTARGRYTDSAGHTRVTSAGDRSAYFGADPQIAIDKVTVDGPIAGDNFRILVGEPIVWRYTVTNVGNVPLSVVTVTDNQPGVTPVYQSGDTNGNNRLDLGETWIFTAAGIAQADWYVNIGTARGRYTDSAGHTRIASAGDRSAYFGADPQIAIDKVTVHGANSGDGLSIPAGQPISWRYTVTNVGNVPLSVVTVTDDQPGVTPVYQSGDTNGNNRLDLGETWIYTAAGIAQPGAYANIGTARGRYTDSAGHTRIDTDTDGSSYFGRTDIIVIGPDKGNTSSPIIKIVDRSTGAILRQFYAYEPEFQGGVRIATGDIDNDGVDEIITAPQRGREPEIRVFRQDGTELTQYRTMAYNADFMGGVNVAVGDVNGDGNLDIVVAPTFGQAEVRVFFTNPLAPDPVPNSPNITFVAFSPMFMGGADVTVADMGAFLNGATINAATPDGKAEIIVGSGPGMTTTIQVYDMTGPPAIVDTVIPFGGAFSGGVDVQTARVDADLIPDIIVGAGDGGGSQVEIWSGRTDDAPDLLLHSFTTFADVTTFNVHVHTAAVDLNGDDIADKIVVVQGTNGTSGQIRSFNVDGTGRTDLPGFPDGWNVAALPLVDPAILVVMQAVMGAEGEAEVWGTFAAPAAAPATSGRQVDAVFANAPASGAGDDVCRPHSLSGNESAEQSAQALSSLAATSSAAEPGLVRSLLLAAAQRRASLEEAIAGIADDLLGADLP
jgi:hypothetical protein